MKLTCWELTVFLACINQSKSRKKVHQGKQAMLCWNKVLQQILILQKLESEKMFSL